MSRRASEVAAERVGAEHVGAGEGRREAVAEVDVEVVERAGDRARPRRRAIRNTIMTTAEHGQPVPAEAAKRTAARPSGMGAGKGASSEW